MTGVIWTKFYWQDWLSDAGLRRCSLAARGVWMDMLCVAVQHDPIGYVAIRGEGLTAKDIARICGEPESVVSTLVEELARNGVLSRDRRGVIYSRRMVRDRKEAAKNRDNGKKGGNPNLRKDEGNPPPDKGRDKAYKLEAKSYKPEDNKIENGFGSFPADGSIAFGPWAERARKAGRNIDVDVLAQAFRSWCRDKDIPFNSPWIGQSFDTFVSKHKLSGAA